MPEVTALKRDTWVEITITGQGDAAAARGLEQTVNAQMARGARVALLDLSAMEIADAAFVRALYRIRQDLERLGGTVIVVAVSPALRRLLEVAGTVEPLTVVESVEEGRGLARAFAADAREESAEGDA